MPISAYFPDAVIRCDYCGSMFDTAEHAVCPHCGGTYYDDEEWMNKNNRKDI